MSNENLKAAADKAAADKAAADKAAADKAAADKAAADKAAADKAAADKAAADKVDPLVDFKTVSEYGAIFLEENQSKEGTFKKVEQLKEAKEAAKKVDGLKAKETQTLTNKGVKLTLVKGMPVSKYFSDLFSNKQKDQYFVK